MEQDINTLFRRFTELKSENEFNMRVRREAITKAVNALNSISGEKLELLFHRFPALKGVREFTVDQLLRNENGELESLRSLYRDMLNALETVLQQMEANV